MSDTPLFHPRTVKDALKAAPITDELRARHARLLPLLHQLANGELDRTNEKSLQGSFIELICGDVLGYRPRYKPSGEVWDLQPEVNVAPLGNKPVDVGIGWFRAGNQPSLHAVVELKSPKAYLDRLQGRKLTPIQQAWDYANETKSCRWILVSNFKETRLYCRGRSTHDLEVFKLSELADFEAFRRFHLLLSRESLLPESLGGRSLLDELLERSAAEQQEITDKLYGDYRRLREAIFEDLRRTHSNLPPLEVLAATQKLLDRVLFIAFAEDRGLLPQHTLKQALTPDYYGTPIWRRLRTVFDWIDKGHKERGFSAFNGGLFAKDEGLDELEPSDETLLRLAALAEYNFAEDVSVEVLGHIFEQGIRDLEELRARATGTVAPELSGRSRHGVFYTPAFVTRYLAEQTIGRCCRERLDEIIQRHAPESSRSTKARDERMSAAMREYRGWLKELRVCDPACGSGAFLVAAFDRLKAEYLWIDKELAELGKPELFDPTATILQANLFGVDLNPESIEVTRLSLWLKTAERGKPLTSLDAHIRCGNSVVQDPKVSPRAFVWANGCQAGEAPATDRAWSQGFDIVIGNPPYVRQELLGEIKEHLKGRFSSFHGMADLFVYFFDLGIGLLRPGGRLGYIVANKWLKGGYAAGLRTMLARECTIEELVDFGHAPIFPDADAFPSILVLRKQAPSSTHELQVAVLVSEPLGDRGIEEVVKDARFQLPQAELGAEGWSLEPKSVRTLMQRLRERGRPLSEWVPGGSLRGVMTGLNEAFMLSSAERERLVSVDPACAPLIRRYLRGRDVQRWAPGWDDVWITTLKSSGDHTWPWSGLEEADAERVFERVHPGLYARAKGNEARLRARTDRGRYWWELRSCAYYDRFDEGKIVYQEIQFNSSYALDTEGFLLNNKVFFLPTSDPWILAVLNSALMWWFNWRYLSHMKDEALNPAGVKMMELPIPTPTEPARAEAAERVALSVAATAESQRLVRDLLLWLCHEHGVDKPGQLLADPASLSADQFLAEVKKRRPKGTGSPAPAALAELKRVHEDTRLPLLRLRKQVSESEAALATLVHAAFGLGPEDLDLLRRTQPPRTPPGLG